MAVLEALTFGPRALLAWIALTLLVTVLGDVTAEAQSTYARWFTYARYVGLGVTVIQVALLGKKLVPYSREVSLGDWQPVGNGYEIVIPRKAHGKGLQPEVTVEGKQGNGYAVVMAAVETRADGAVVVGVGDRYEVRVTIRP